jgi:2-polyprenyl-6-methoxyphenol hydroxylase-like FAD-dependent oxidoreductase
LRTLKNGHVLDILPSGSIIREIVWASNFKVSHRQAETYNIGGVFLAGDASHIHSPIGGRGMNMGIEDSTILARKIVNGGLESYSKERHKVGAAAIRMIRMMTLIATASNIKTRFIRNYLIPAILSIYAFRQHS